MEPVVDGLESSYAGRVKIKRMNVDGSDEEATRLAESCGVEYVPTFVFVSSGGTVSKTMVGEFSEPGLSAQLDRLVD